MQRLNPIQQSVLDHIKTIELNIKKEREFGRSDYDELSQYSPEAIYQALNSLQDYGYIRFRLQGHPEPLTIAWVQVVGLDY